MGARIGVVGLGRIGSYHARNLLTLNGVDSLVVTDVDARRTADVATELDVQSATDPAALLASGIDGVLIAASSSSHADLIEAAVRRDIPTFCEKPVADSIESSVRVLATAEQTSVPVQIGFQRRFDPSFVAAYDAVRSGELGWIHTLRSTTLDPAPPPISYIEHSGGIFRDCSIHDFDIVRWISGREVTTVLPPARIRVIAGSPMPVTSTPPQRFSLSKAEPSRSCRIPATTAAATTADSRYSARRTPSLPGWTTACHSARSTSEHRSPRRSRTRSSWTASRPPTARNSKHSSALSPGVGNHRARPQMRSSRPGSPKLQRALCARVGPSRSPKSKICSFTTRMRHTHEHSSHRRRTDLLGVCEVPDWGYQLDPAQVLREMREVGLAATEIGPEGFLPTAPAEMAKVLADHDLSAVGGFAPVLLHDRDHDPVPGISPILDGFVASGAEVLVLAAATGSDGYDSRPELDEQSWKTLLHNLDRLTDAAAERGIRAVVHPHVGTMIEQRDEVLRVLDGSAIPCAWIRPPVDRRHRSGRPGASSSRAHHPRASQGRRRCPRITRSQR